MADRREIVTAAAIIAAMPRQHEAAADTGETNALHITMLNFKPSLTQGQRALILDVIRGLANQPEVQYLALAPNIEPKRSDGPIHFEWLSSLGYANVADHKVYSVCEARKEMGKHFMPNQAGWVVADIHAPGLSKFWQNEKPKIRHAVMFNFKDEISASVQQRHIETMRSLGKLRMVKALAVERNVHWETVNSDIEWVLLADFTSVDDFKKFQADDQYQRVVRDVFGLALRQAVSLNADMTAG